MPAPVDTVLFHQPEVRCPAGDGRRGAGEVSPLGAANVVGNRVTTKGNNFMINRRLVLGMIAAATTLDDEQSANDCDKRKPPREHAGAFAAEPVARGVRRRFAHRRLGTARRSARLAGALGLNWWTRHRAVGTENATIAYLRSQPLPATGALIKELAGIGRHSLRFRGAAVRTGDDGLQNHSANPWVPTDNPRWW